MSDTCSAARPRAVAAPLAAVLLLAVGASRPAPARAQGVPAGGVRAEAALSAAHLAGSDFEGTGAGVGGEAGVRYGLTPRLSLGLLGRGHWHAADGLDGPLRVVGVVLAPRYRAGGRGSGLTPFVGARVGVARWSATESADSLSADVRADGLSAGGIVGVGYALSRSAVLEFAAAASYLDFGDAAVDAALGEPLPPFTRAGSGTSGALLGLRAGLRVKLP